MYLELINFLSMTVACRHQNETKQLIEETEERLMKIEDRTDRIINGIQIRIKKVERRLEN